MIGRRYAHKIPFIVKLNHNELLTYPSQYDQIMFGSAREAYELGAVGVGATIYFGSEHATRQIQEVSEAFQEAHALGMFTVLWCYLRNSAFKKDGVDYSLAADLTGQANHLGVTIEADIIKQKQAENNGGYGAVGFGRTDPLVYEPADHRQPDRPHPLAGGQLLHGPHSADQQRRGVARVTPIWPRRCAPPSSTSGPAAPGSSPGARPSSGHSPKAWRCCTPSRTSISTRRSPWPEPRTRGRSPAVPAAPIGRVTGQPLPQPEDHETRSYRRPRYRLVT